MALQKSIIWKQITLETAYFKIIRECSRTFLEIIIGVYTCRESKDAEDSYIYTIAVPVPDEIINTLFTEDVLKLPNISNTFQSYIYLKTLEEYSTAVDV